MTTQRTRSAGRPTLDEVAALAGVGRGTVSRVVNGSPQVSPEARAAVQDAIKELGYVPNRAARALVTQRTDSVVLVVSESHDRVFAQPYLPGL
jgi:DNA-binding LacI/PurR family transcriptional regulator